MLELHPDSEPVVLDRARHRSPCALCGVLLMPGLPVFGHSRGWTCYSCFTTGGASSADQRPRTVHEIEAEVDELIREVEERVRRRPRDIAERSRP